MTGSRQNDNGAPLPAEGDAERIRMGRIAGGLWILGALIGVAGAFMPGAEHEGLPWVFALSALVLAYGVASVAGLWDRASVRSLAIGMVATVPLVGVGLYLTGASISYIEPLLVCSLLYAAFFFPARWAWPLTVELLIAAGTPLLYDEQAIRHAYPARYLALSAGFLAVTAVVIRVKRRLVEAERAQREIANRDALTGIPNRRLFDAALRGQLGEAGRLALLIVDLDDFKSINDVHGHQVGDAVLRGAAARMDAALRETDILARIGGDEFAVIAPAADADGAGRLAERLQTVIGEGDPGSGLPVPRASVGWSVFPHDGESFETLLHCADERLLELKHRRGGLSVVASQAASAELVIRDQRQPTGELAG